MQLYPTKAEFTTVMGDVASVTGMVTIALMLVSKYVFTFLNWRGAALITPLVMAVSGEGARRVPWSGGMSIAARTGQGAANGTACTQHRACASCMHCLHAAATPGLHPPQAPSSSWAAW